MLCNDRWNKSYQESENLWGSNPDPKLMQYLDLIQIGNVLDMGIGEGRNSIPFAMRGFNIDGVDTSESAINSCKKKFKVFNSVCTMVCEDLKTLKVKKDNYSLIIASSVLNFFAQKEIESIIGKIKFGLNDNGIVYFSAFSTLDPNFASIRQTRNEVEENTFYIKEKDSYVHFFTQEEIREFFSDYELICICEGLECDFEADTSHYHGIIEFMSKKKRK